MRLTPPREDFMTIDDVPDERLENGMATILRLQKYDPGPGEVLAARVDEQGFLKTLDGRDAYFRHDWEVIE